LTRVKIKKILQAFARRAIPFYNSINEYFFVIIELRRMPVCKMAALKSGHFWVVWRSDSGWW